MTNIILQDILDKLTGELDEYCTIAIDNSEEVFAEQYPDIVFPYILLDIIDVEYDNRKEKIQTGDGTLRIRGINKITPFDAEIAYNIHHIFTRIFKALESFSGENYSNFTRKKLYKVDRRDGLQEFDMLFDFMLYDVTAHLPTTIVSADPDFTVEKIK